ncbi:hypothetical protein RJ639_034467 [Escallonia herrerae]|uniref:OTU domain-containing protein n=1 Tax=Escallonia herrerae TaxID=1293975 RepID=A0AA88X8P4_9ASTE|nr:hypothetical protein RJ639_034467 [Escallonia herrerae]
MTPCELDPDVVRWGLHLLDVCTLSNDGAPSTITLYDMDLSRVEYVREGYCETKQINVENDEVIAHALQEELSRLADAETSRLSHAENDYQQASILAQDWFGPSKRYGNDSSQEEEGERGIYASCSTSGEKLIEGEDQLWPEIEDESTLDSEVGKRMDQMIPVPHIPKINGEIPSVDEETSDHQRLMDRLQLYDLVELKVSGDGNCQFRSLSDQIYRTTDYHKLVREQIVDQLTSHPELYEGYVPWLFMTISRKLGSMTYLALILSSILYKAQSCLRCFVITFILLIPPFGFRTGEWGDHVTLQAAADVHLARTTVEGWEGATGLNPQNPSLQCLRTLAGVELKLNLTVLLFLFSSEVLEKADLSSFILTP